MAPEREDVWSFSPFIDLSIYNWFRRNLPVPRLFDWQITFLFTIVGFRFLQTELLRFFPTSIFALESPNLWVEGAIYLSAVMVVGTELKIFNTVRIQIKLEEQERLACIRHVPDGAALPRNETPRHSAIDNFVSMILLE